MSADSPVERSAVVLVVGAASRDVVDDDPRGWRLGGAVMFASLTLARLGLGVRALVGVDRVARTAHELDLLRSAGVELAFVELASAPVFDNERHLLLSPSDRIPLEAHPHHWSTGNDGVVLGPVADEIADEWVALADPRTPPRPVVGLGWQGLLRVLAPNEVIRPRAPVPSQLLRAAHLVVASEADVAPDVPPEALLGLLRPEARLVWTEGENGGRVLWRDPATGIAATRYPAIPSDRVVDATGAGDVFLAAMLAGWLLPSLGDPLTLAAAAASLNVEGAGLAGVPDLAAVRRRMTRPPSLARR